MMTACDFEYCRNAISGPLARKRSAKRFLSAKQLDS
jgi:hypothetical protein